MMQLYCRSGTFIEAFVYRFNAIFDLNSKGFYVSFHVTVLFAKHGEIVIEVVVDGTNIGKLIAIWEDVFMLVELKADFVKLLNIFSFLNLFLPILFSYLCNLLWRLS